MECLNIVKECGKHGFCMSEVINATEFERCFCEDGWTQTKEMSLYFVSEREFDAGVSICNSNDTALLIIYILVFFSGVAPPLYQLTFIRKSKQLIRLFAFFLGQSLQIAMAVYRLTSPEVALFGADLPFTILTANAVMFIWVGITIFNNRYFRYLTKHVPLLSDEKSIARFKFHHSISNIAVGLDVIFYQLWWIPLLLDDEETQQKREIFRASLFLLLARLLYYIAITTLILNRFIGDMEAFLVLGNERSSFVATNGPSKLDKHIRKRLLPFTKALKVLVVFMSCLYGSFLFVGGISDASLIYLGFMFPFVFIFWGYVNFIAIQVNGKKMKKQITSSRAITSSLQNADPDVLNSNVPSKTSF